MVSLARKTLLREWPRFIPAVLGIAFAGLLLIVQFALVLGIFGSAAMYVTKSNADLWVGYPGTQSVNYGRNISSSVEVMLRMSPEVVAVEPLVWVDADWQSESSDGKVPVFVTGISTSADSQMYDQLLTPPLRALLREPGAIIIDEADLGQLGIAVADPTRPDNYGRIDGKPVHVVAVISGLRALGGVNVVTSLESGRELDSRSAEPASAAYWVAKLRNPELAAVVATQLNGKTAFGPYEVWTASDFARQSQIHWILDTGAGVAVLFMAVIVLLVGIVVASQSLTSVVISSAREYATLNALGAGVSALRRVVLEQAAWLGCAGLLVSAGLAAGLLLVATAHDIPVAMSAGIAGLCALLVLAISLVSGLLAMRGLMRADPVQLLR